MAKEKNRAEEDQVSEKIIVIDEGTTSTRTMLFGADGTPLALTDSRNAAIANAIENDLVPLSVH